MILETAIASLDTGLPQLRGRLLWAYRAAFVLLGAAAVAVLGDALIDQAMQPLVLGLRLVKSAILIAVALILLRKRPRDPVAAILSLAFLCWTITSSVDFTSSEILPMLLDRLRFLLFAFALLLFPDGKWRPRWTRHLAAASVAAFVLGVIETIGLVPTRLFLPFAIACVLGAIASRVRRFRTTSSETQQQQLKWVALGLVSGVGLILSARAGAALSMPSFAFEAMFQLGIVLVALGFLVPLLRYRLYDAETVISRSAGYAVLTAALVAIFAASEALIETLGQQYLGTGIGQLSGAVAAAVAAALFAPLNERIGHWAEQRFQRDLVHLKAELPRLLAELPTDWSPRQVGNAALPRIADAVHARSAAILLKDVAIAAQGTALKDVTPSDGQFPARVALRCPFGGIQGWLLIGPRPDGSAYNKDELETLDAVAPSLRRALLASLDRQKDRRREASARRALELRIAALEQRVSPPARPSRRARPARPSP
jgi:hypothetical protein